MIRGHIDRPSPRALDPRAGKAWQQPSQALLGTRGGRRVLGEARVDATAEADRPAAAPHEHPPVVRRPEVVDEHPPVDDRLAPGPADLGEQVRHGLGEDDVRAEVRHVPANRPPAGGGGVRRDDDGPRAAEILEPGGRAFVQRDAGVDRLPPQDADETRGLDGGALGGEDAAAEHGRADPLRHLVARQRHRLLRRADEGGRLDGRVERAVLLGRRRDGQHPALAQPDVLTERAHRRDDPLPCAGDRERAGLPEHPAGAPDAGPVAVQEAAVAAARPGAAAFRLEQDDVRRRVSLLDRERGPQAGEAAADDADVGVDGALERVGHVVAERGRRLLQPPRGPEH